MADKHAELDARRSDLARQMAALDQELTCLEAAIRVFTNARKPMSASAPTVGPLSPRHPAERSVIADDALSVLRDASRPLSTSDIVRALCTKRNVVLRPLEFRRMAVAVISALRLREARALVAEVGALHRAAAGGARGGGTGSPFRAEAAGRRMLMRALRKHDSATERYMYLAYLPPAF